MTQTPTPTSEVWDTAYAAAEAQTLKQLGDIEQVIGPTAAVSGIREAVTVTMRQAYNEKTAAIRADRDAKVAQIALFRTQEAEYKTEVGKLRAELDALKKRVG